MDVTVKVKRYDPDAYPSGPYWQEYPISVDDNATVLDCLIQIREDVDGTLSLRCSCRSSICGSCAMRINGHAGLGCKTKASQSMDENGVIVVEPTGVMESLKDLVVDFDLFWKKIEQVEPYLKPEGAEPEAEYIASNESMLHLSGVTACIMCGACVSDCTVLEVDPTFLGPAALAKAYRFTADPRDGDQNGVSRDRLSVLGDPSGMWDCTRCNECVQVCPKGVAPMDRIMELRDSLMQAGVTNTPGARHVESFAKSVARSGWLDETMLAVDSWGKFNVPKLVGEAPLGLRVLRRGKFPMPGPFHHKRPGHQSVRRLFERLGALDN